MTLPPITPAFWNPLVHAWQSFLNFQAQPTGETRAAAAVIGMDPAVSQALVQRYAVQAAVLLRSFMSRTSGTSEPVIRPAPGDRRFSSAEWREYPYFDFLKQSYLLASNFILDWARMLPGDAEQKHRAEFWARQLVDALSPSNFLATNPEAIREAFATDGESLQRGVANLARDLDRGRIAMTDPDAFEVGRNLAITPGAVVFRNELIELIQYRPLTAEVHSRPLVIVPPCINKYYILDLQPQNSFVRFALEQGHTVFLVSWRNIPSELGHLTWDDYVGRGVLQAISVAQAITGSESVNALGFCVGGTLLATALAVLAARDEPIVASATFLTTMLDFADPGEIRVYIDPLQIEERTEELAAGGRLHGSELANAFASLRSNELVWSFVINNYLRGRTPAAFDLLHWNADSANLPGPMYLFYVGEMYIRNRLREADALTVCGQTVNLGRITIPAYLLATREDHIVPWRSAYKTAGLLGGEVRFVLGASGHIAGVVNPPVPGKRSYWVHHRAEADPDAWLDQALSHPGSWWKDWRDWLADHDERRVAARERVGNEQYPPLAEAPGSYVLEKA
jgi:polyhydroxyalkanoate synthase